MDLAEFGALLREMRRQRGWSLRDLAAVADVNHGSLSHAERGDPRRGLSPEAIERLDAALLPSNGHRPGALITAHRRLPARTRPAHIAEDEPDLLPPAPSLLIGRDEVMQQLVTAGEPADRRAPAVLVLSGPGGIGKTTLACAAAHAVRPRMRGAMWADLRGWAASAGPRPVESVLRSWCRACGLPDAAMGGDPAELAESWRRVSASRPLVVVADNVATPDQLIPLLPGRADSLVIVTTRSRRALADDAVRVDLGPLPDAAAVRLLATRTGWPEAAVAVLVAPCGGWPLALVNASTEAAAHWTPEELTIMADDLQAADENDAVDRSTRLSYAALEYQHQEVWRWCSLIGGVLAVDQAAAVTARAGRDVRLSLKTLVEANLLDRVPGGVVYLDKLAEFARRESARTDPRDVRDAALHRGLSWLVHGLVAAGPLIAGRDDMPVLDPVPPGVDVPEHTGYQEALAWTEEHWSYPAPVVAALEHGWVRLAWQLVAAGISASYVLAPITTWDDAAAAVLATDAATLEPEGRAWCEHARGLAAGAAGDPARAAAHLLTALRIRRELPDGDRDRGWSALNAARWLLATGAADSEIRPLIEEGLAAHAEIQHIAGLMLGESLLGALAERARQWDLAAQNYATAHAYAPRVPDPALRGWAQTALAAALLHTTDPDPAQATELALDAERDARDAGMDWGRIGALVVLADAQPSRAREALATAASIAARIGDGRERPLRDRLDDLDPDLD